MRQLADERTLLESSPLRNQAARGRLRVTSEILHAQTDRRARDAMPEPYRALVILLADAAQDHEALTLTRASIEREDGGCSGGGVAVSRRQALRGRADETAAGVRTVALMAATATTMRAISVSPRRPDLQSILFPAPGEAPDMPEMRR